MDIDAVYFFEVFLFLAGDLLGEALLAGDFLVEDFLGEDFLAVFFLAAPPSFSLLEKGFQFIPPAFFFCWSNMPPPLSWYSESVIVCFSVAREIELVPMERK
jgi:hypothetical protein